MAKTKAYFEKKVRFDGVDYEGLVEMTAEKKAELEARTGVKYPSEAPK